MEHTDDPAGLVPGDFLCHVASYLVLAGTPSGTFFPFLSFMPVFYSAFPAGIGSYCGLAAMFRYDHIKDISNGMPEADLCFIYSF